MAKKVNDWVAAQMNAPVGVTSADFYANGITPENTEIQSRDYYRNIPQVQEAFNKNGQLDEVAFNQFYDSALRTYNEFSNEDFIENYIKTAARHKYDWHNLEAPVKDLSAYMLEASDKNRHTQGLGNIWQKGDAVFSDREVAQANYVRDENGNVLDWTANDKGGLFKSIFSPTLALAIWEEDGEHMERGMVVEHKKGDLKLDENGDPYTEILGNRESYGRDIVKWSDILTEEGSFWNKIDPFDSDGLDKGIGRTIAETAIKVAPYFIPYVGPYLGAISAATALAGTIPTLAKGVAGLVSDNEKTAFGKAMTRIENFMGKFDNSTSDASKGNFWSAENLGDLVSSSFGQLASQKVIAKIPKLLNPATKNTELGRKLALGYMAATSATDSYSAFKDAGATDAVAGIGMLATIGAMYGMMNVDYFKNWLFKDTWLDEEIEFRHSFKDWIKSYSAKAFKETPVPINPNSLTGKLHNTKLYSNFYAPIKNFVSDYIINGKYLGGSVVVNRMLNEGIEETMEEALGDAVKALTLGIEAMGFKVTKDPNAKLDFGFSAKDILSRYSSAFLGGALGGAVFEGYNNWENFIMDTTSKITSIEDLDERMIWYMRNGYFDQMIADLDKKYRNHELPANRHLSVFFDENVDNFENSEFKDGVYAQGDSNNNQEKALYNILRTRLITMKNILDEHVILYSDKELVRNVFHQKGVENLEKIAKDKGITVKELQEKYLYDEEIEALRAAGLLDNVIGDAQELSKQIFNYAVQLRKAKSELASESEENKVGKSRKVKELEDHLKLLKDQYEDLVSGKGAGRYIADAWYTVNGPLLDGYLNHTGDGVTYFPQTDIRHFTKWRYNLNYDELLESHQKLIQSEFDEFSKSKETRDQIKQIKNVHYALSKQFSGKLEEIKKTYEGYKEDPYHLRDSFLDSELRDQNIMLLNVAIATLEQKSETTSLTEEEQAQLEVFKQQLKVFETQESLVEFRSTLSEQGESELGKWLNPTELSDADRMNYRTFVKNFYTKLANDKIVSPYEGQLFARYLESESAPMKEWDFQTHIDNICDSLIQEFGEEIDPTDLEVSSNAKTTLITLAKSFWQDLASNPEKARSAYNHLIEYVRDNFPQTTYTPEMIVNAILGTNPTSYDETIVSIGEMLALAPVNVPELIDFIDEIEEIRHDIKISSVHELLADLSFIMHGKTLNALDILQRESADLHKNTDMSDYIVDPSSLEELRAAKHVVQIAMSLVQTAADGTNAKINQYQQGDDKFTTIDISQGDLFIRDLLLIHNRLSKLIELAENNEQSLIDEQQDIATNMFPKMVKSLINPSIDDDDDDRKLIPSIIAQVLGKDEAFIKSLWDESISLDSITKGNYKEFYKQYLTFASKLRAAYLEAVVKEGSAKAFGKKLAESIKGLNFKSTKFTSMEDEQVTMYDSLVFFLTLVGADTLEWESKFKTAAAKETKLLPYFSQEFAAHTAWARVHNGDLFDGFLETLKLNGSDANAYIEKMPSLSRFMMVDGSGGTGKSTGVAKFLWNILKEEGFDILVISNDKDRANALKETLGVGDEVVKTTSEVLKSILGKDYDLKDYNMRENDKKPRSTEPLDGHHLLDPTTLPEATLKAANPFTDPSLSDKIMIIDEVTLLDEMQLQIFSEFAKYGKDNVTILGLGDSKQNAKTIDGKTSGIEDCKYIKAPSLTASLRKTCRGKKLNLNIVGTILSAVEDFRSDHPEKQDSDLANETQRIINVFAGNGRIELAYFDEGGLFGEKFSEDPKSEVDTIIGYLKEGEKLAILVDDAGHAEYADVKAKYGDKVEVLNSAQIQGGQFAYVIVDKTFNSDPKSKRTTFKDFYTAISRSTTGTIIGTKKSDIRKIFDDKIGHIKRHDAAALIVNPADERYTRIAQRYRDWRTDLFDLVPNINTASGTTGSTTSGGTTSSTSSSSGTSGGATSGTSGTSGSTTGGTTGGGESLSYDEIKAKISQVRQDEDVTEDDIYKEYEDEEKTTSEYAKQYRKRLSIKEKYPTAHIDPEIFEKWINSNDEIAPFMKQFGLNPDSNSDINGFRQSLRIFSSVILESKYTSFDAIPNGVMENIKIPALKTQVTKGLKDGFLEWVTKGSESTLFYCFSEGPNKFAIPIARSENSIKGKVDITTIKKHTGIIPISSKGRIQKRIKDVCGDKIPSWSTLGIFVGDKANFGNVRNMGWGKAYIPLVSWGQWHENFAENFFKVQTVTEKDGSTINWAWNGYDPEPIHRGVAVGVQKSIDFETFLKLCECVRIVKSHKNIDKTEAVNVLSAFFGSKIEVPKYGESQYRPEVIEKNAQEIANSETTLLYRSRVASMITSLVRFFSQYQDGSVRTKFFEQLIKMAPENSSPPYKSGFSVTFPTLTGSSDIEFFLENTKEGFEVYQYDSVEGTYKALGIKKLNNFSKAQTDGSGLGVINIYQLIKELVIESGLKPTDLVGIGDVTAASISELNDNELVDVCEQLFAADAIRFGVKTRYEENGTCKYYVPNEAFLMHDLIGHCKSNDLIQLGKFIDNETVFRHGIYCNIRSEKQFENNKEWRFRDIDSDAEQENYVWDIIDVILPIYSFTPTESTSDNDWGKFLQQFSNEPEQTISGISPEVIFERKIDNESREWIELKNPDESYGLLLDPSKGLIGQDLIDKYFSTRSRSDKLMGISPDGKHVHIMTAEIDDVYIDLDPAIDMSAFKIPEIKNVIATVNTGGLEGEVTIKKGFAPILTIDGKKYKMKLCWPVGENAILLFDNKVTVTVPIESLQLAPNALNNLKMSTYETFGKWLGQYSNGEQSFIYFEKGGEHTSYDVDTGRVTKCKIVQYGNECYVFDEDSKLRETIPMVNLTGLLSEKCYLTSGSYLETTDNKTYKVSGELRIPTVVLRAIVSDDVEISLTEHTVSAIDLDNKTISGSFGQLNLSDKFNIGILNLGSNAIKVISTYNEEFVKKLNDNPTLKRVLGDVKQILNEIESSDTMSDSEIIDLLNELLSNQKYDLGKWWVIEYKNNRVSVKSRRDNETLIGKELKESGIENVVDVEIVSGQESWKSKEIIVTLSDDSKQTYVLSRDRKTDKWSIKFKDVESDSKDGILDISDLQSLLNQVKDTYLSDGTPLIKPEWTNALEVKIESLKSGKDVSGVYNNLMQQFAIYMNSMKSDPNYVETIKVMTTILQKIRETETNNNCKLG